MKKLVPKNPSTTLEATPNWVQRLLNRAPIRLKISLGYALALGIATLGTCAGHTIGDIYSKKALQRLDHEQEEERLLSRFKIAVQGTRNHQLELIVIPMNSKDFEQQRADLLDRNNQVRDSLLQLQSLSGNYYNPNSDESVALNQFIQTYRKTIETYSQQIQLILKPNRTTNLGAEEISAIKQGLLEFSKSNKSRTFEAISDKLTQLVEMSYQGQDRAEVELKQAELWRIHLTSASLLLSLSLAIALAFYTSRTISRPLEAVTKVAQQATKESNFHLQAPITTDDEVAVLATSLNSLIHSVAEHTKQLELANANLEKRVEERTEELSQKNSLLKQAHDELEIALKNLQQAQVQLIQAEKMSSLGQMVAGIAHEINNPVSFIYSNIEYANNYAQDLLGLVELYQQQYPHPTAVIQAETEAIDLSFLREDLPKLLGSMKAGADRIRQIILSLRNFSRLDESELKPANINEGIDSTLLILNNCFAKIELIKQYGDLPLVQCYPALLNQVLMNILNNAVDALELKEANPTIWIGTEIVDDDCVKVRIRDNGPGISEEIKGKLFDPFFTTKDVGKGTGLGLTICYQIVEKHKGKIEISSELGQGTEVAIALPVKSSL